MLVKGREKLQKRLENHTIFHKYLDRVLESAEEFHEIREVIARYDTLTATHLVSEPLSLSLSISPSLLSLPPSLCLSLPPSLHPSLPLSLPPSVYPSLCPSLPPSLCPSLTPSLPLSLPLSLPPYLCTSIPPSLPPSILPPSLPLFLGRQLYLCCCDSDSRHLFRSVASWDASVMSSFVQSFQSWNQVFPGLPPCSLPLTIPFIIAVCFDDVTKEPHIPLLFLNIKIDPIFSKTDFFFFSSP